MKYTNYIIKGDLVSEKALDQLPKVLLPVTITVAFIGIIVLTGVLPLAVLGDGIRNIQCRAIHFKRNGYKLQ